MCHVGMLHGIIPIHKKWTCEVSTKFLKLVMNVNDEREIVLHGRVMGRKDTRFELEISGPGGLNIGEVLVTEGNALYAGQEDPQLPFGDSQGTEEGLLLPVLSSLGDRAAKALAGLDGSLPDQHVEEVDSIRGQP